MDVLDTATGGRAGGREAREGMASKNCAKGMAPSPKNILPGAQTSRRHPRLLKPPTVAECDQMTPVVFWTERA